MPIPPPEAEASVIDAWLRFLARDMEDHPRRMASLDEAEAAALAELVRGVTVRDDEVLPDEVTF
jgi:hypothetical protein